MTSDSLYGLSESLWSFEAVLPDIHSLVGLSDILCCVSVKKGPKLGFILVVFFCLHTVTDWSILVTFHSSVSTCEATASCTTMLDVIRGGRRPASIPLDFWWLIVYDWLRMSSVV